MTALKQPASSPFPLAPRRAKIIPFVKLEESGAIARLQAQVAALKQENARLKVNDKDRSLIVQVAWLTLEHNAQLKGALAHYRAKAARPHREFDGRTSYMKAIIERNAVPRESAVATLGDQPIL